MKKSVYLFLVLFWALSACTKKNTYSHMAEKPLPVEIEVVSESSRQVEDTYIGEIRPALDIPLVFPMGGELTGVYVKSGDKVRADQIIATVDSTQAVSLLHSAEATFAQAKDAYSRLKPLHKQGGISDVKWVEMQTNLEKARSMFISARKRVEDCTLRAPQAGTVTLKGFEVGTHLSFSQSIGMLMDLSQYRVEFTVPESEIGRLQCGEELEVSLPALNKHYQAVISEKSLEATRLSHTYLVKALINSPEAKDDLLPGMVCRAIVRSREHKGYIVSAGSIQTQQNGHSVWVLRDGKAKRQMVTLSAYVENGVLVSEGVNLGDTIITKGYQKMFNGAKVAF